GPRLTCAAVSWRRRSPWPPVRGGRPMDCRTARTLLDYHRPTDSELSGPDAADLERHLDVCPECGALAQAERRADARLGRAMRDVPLPDGLHDRLLARLAADRRAVMMRRFARGSRYAAAAALVLATLLGVGWWTTRPRPLDGQAVLDKY